MTWLPGGTFKLQAALAMATAEFPIAGPSPHHPITCPEGALEYDLDAEILYCSHAETEPHDPRTKSCLNSTVAYLILEMASNL